MTCAHPWEAIGVSGDGHAFCTECSTNLVKDPPWLPQPPAVPLGAEGWISVNDRLPVDDMECLYVWNGQWWPGKYLGCDNEDSLPCFGGKYGFLTGDVTHWMPIPKLPGAAVTKPALLGVDLAAPGTDRTVYSCKHGHFETPCPKCTAVEKPAVCPHGFPVDDNEHQCQKCGPVVSGETKECQHDLQRPDKTVRMHQANGLVGWKCTVCDGVWLPALSEDVSR